MKFYEMIFKHYDDIFPYNKETYSFLREGLQDEDKVLDVACGTGTYSIALQKDGMNLCGLDLDENMISLAEEKAEEAFVNPDFVVSSMLNLDLVSDGDLRRIYTIGNALVHLKSLEEIQTFLSLSYELLKDGGDLIIRILNYDRILDNKIDKLPTLEVPLKGITFERNYSFDEASELIEFSSILSVKDQTKEASIYLLPIRKDALLLELSNAGFKEIELYGSFKKEPYTDESTSLVIKAKKVEEA
ncbi:MAG: class I SAM-dependent methyltransferase [Clostridium sp.]|nr:class I SAM-dependent methyltransferase [Clostridium sp.]